MMRTGGVSISYLSEKELIYGEYFVPCLKGSFVKARVKRRKN